MIRPITAADLWSLARVGRPAAAFDGSFAIVPVTTFDVTANKGTTRLHRIDRNGATTPLTAPGVSSTNPVVSPDGRRVAFLRSRDDDRPQIAVMRLDGGEAVTVTDLPLGAGAPRWLPDGAGLVFPVPLLRGHATVEATETERNRRRDAKLKAIATEDRIYRYWKKWLADGEVQHLFTLDLDSGALADLMAGTEMWLGLDDTAGSFDVAPDGSEVAFTADVSTPPHDRLAFAVHTVSLDGGALQRLPVELKAHQRRPRYRPDGSSLLYGIQVEHDFYADRVRLASYDRQTGRETILTEAWDLSAEGWEWDGTDRILCGAVDGGRQRLFHAAPEPGIPEGLEASGSVRAASPAGSVIWCLHEDAARPPEVALHDGTALRVVSTFNAEALAGLTLGDTEEITVTGSEGRPVQVLMVYPPGYDRSSPLPLLHNIHGGPHGSSMDAWHWRWNTQVFAAGGYAVASVNFHGSEGWGQEFTASIHGAWGDKPAYDIQAATDHLIERGIADPDRMAIAGGSYGGYLVAWLTGITNRFRCAINHAGVSDLLGQWASDVTSGRERSVGGVPWDDLDAVQRWSPIAHTALMETPMLIMHGEQDYRVVITQGLVLYGVLKAKGVEARLVYYPDEGHWIEKPQNSIHWYGEFGDWLDRHLAGPEPGSQPGS